MITGPSGQNSHLRRTQAPGASRISSTSSPDSRNLSAPHHHMRPRTSSSPPSSYNKPSASSTSSRPYLSPRRTPSPCPSNRPPPDCLATDPTNPPDRLFPPPRGVISQPAMDPGPTQVQPCRYKVGKTLGAGSYSVVKECVHIDTGRYYAAKVINKRLMAGREHMVGALALITAFPPKNGSVVEQKGERQC